jgi:hypothetical protein
MAPSSDLNELHLRRALLRRCREIPRRRMADLYLLLVGYVTVKSYKLRSSRMERTEPSNSGNATSICRSTFCKLRQFDHRDGKLREATVQADQKLRECPNSGLVDNILEMSEMNYHLSRKFRLIR